MRVNLPVMVDIETKQRLDAMGINKSEFVRELIEAALRHMDSKNPEQPEVVDSVEVSDTNGGINN